MPINVRATVVDITQDRPHATDTFLLDTNVLYWSCYLTAEYAQPAPYQRVSYLPYLDAARLVGATLKKSLLSLAELSHLIERDEYKIFKAATGQTPTLKEYRHNYPDERARIAEEIETAWLSAELLTNYQTLSVPSSADASQCLTALKALAIDGYDVLIYETARQLSVHQIITDDADYGELPNLRIFTANNKLIDLARAQGKLVTR